MRQAPVPALPLYSRIQETLRTQLLSGHFRAGDRMPSETNLAAQYRTTRATVRQALAQLEFEGLIVRQTGRGTFAGEGGVAALINAERPQSFEDQVRATGAKVTFRLLGFNPEAASERTAAALNLKAGDLVYRLHRLRLVDGVVIGCENRTMPSRIGSAVPAAALATQSAVRIVEGALAAPLGGMTVSVSARSATAETAAMLGIRRGNPVLVRSHIFFDSKADPVLEGDSLYRGDKYHFIYRFGHCP